MKPTDDGRLIVESRLIAQNYCDKTSAKLPTKAPTISRMAQRTCISLMVMDTGKSAYTRDISQAYKQSKFKLKCPIYLEPVKKFNLRHGKIWKAKRPLYGIPEVRLHWFLIYRDCHMKPLALEWSRIDNCNFFERFEGGLAPTIVIFHVDDSLGFGTKLFLQEENESSKDFVCKQKKF